MISPEILMIPSNPPPPFAEIDYTTDHLGVGSTGMPENQQHIQAPAYSHYPSAECPRFELETLGKTFITREKYLCGDLLDDRYFLLGSTTYLEFIDLTLPPEQQVPRKLIEFVRFKQIKVLQNERYEGLLTLAGKNNHIRIYDLTSIRLLIKSKMTSFASLFHKRLHGHGRSRSMDSIPDMTTRDQEEEHAIVSRRHHTLNLSQICNNSLPNLPSLSHTRSNSSSTNNENFASPLSSSSSSTNSHNGPTIHHRQHARYESLQHPLAPSTSSEVRDRLENLQVQWSLNYQKLPKTKMAISFTLRSGPTRTYLAILSRQNIFLFELDFGEVNRGPEFVHNRTYWLPQTPKFLQMSMYEDQLLDIIAVFDTEVFMIGVEDARVREITIDSNLCPSNGKMLIPLPSFIHESPSWQTFEQLPWIPILDPELVSDTFTIPPPYSVIINEDPSKMLNPVPIFESENPDLMNSTGPTLFFATFGSKSMIVDVQGRVFSTIVFEWTFPPNHVEFLRSAGSRNESFVVGFGKSMVEVRSFSTGRIVENVVRGAEVQFLGRGLGGKDVIWKCSPRKGSKETSFYRLEGPKI